MILSTTSYDITFKCHFGHILDLSTHSPRVLPVGQRADTKLIYPSAFSESRSDVSSLQVLPSHYTEQLGISVCMPFFTGSSDVRVDSSYLYEIAGDYIVNITTTSWFQFFIRKPEVDYIELIFS